MKIQQTFVSISTLFFIVGCGGGAVSTGSTETTAVSDSSAAQSTNSGIVSPNPYPADKLSDDERESYLKAINDARSVSQDCGTKGEFPPAAALAWSEELYAASYEHSNDMAQSNTFAHEGSGTDSDWTGIALGKASTVSERLENNGYTKWRKIGENIAAGTQRDTAQKAVNAWLESDEHCAILMDEGYTEIGMAHVEIAEAYYTHYWTQNFGRR